jgi:drug/metabolite transporter (DMT)-like permease
MTWLWIPITIFAAAAQTARNAAQRGLIQSAGTLGATLVRFLYGLPFAALWLLILHFNMADPAPGDAPVFSPAYIGWIAMGGVAQLLATAFLLMAMQTRSFAVATAYSKTEVLQVALFGFLLLGEGLGPWSMLAIALSAVGVVLLSLKPAAQAGEAVTPGRWWSALFSPAALYGVAAGGGFALSAVGYRGAALLHPEWSPFYSGAFNLVWAQSIQTLLLGGWLLARKPEVLRVVMREWRLSLTAGALGATSSIGWFTAFAMRNAADVRALSLVEVLFSYFISRRVFKEKAGGLELAGMGLLMAGLVVLVLSA